MQAALSFLRTSSDGDARSEREGVVVGVSIQHSGVSRHYTVGTNSAVDHSGICVNNGTRVDCAVDHSSTRVDRGVGVNRARVNCCVVVND